MKTKIISAIENAFAEGSDCAKLWMEINPDPKSPPQEELTSWRTCCHANIVRTFESGSVHGYRLCQVGTDRPEFLKLLAEWERGFDRKINKSKKYHFAASVTPPAPSNANDMQRLAVKIKIIAALLSVIKLLPDTDQKNNLAMCTGMVSAVARDLAMLISEVAA